MPDPKQPHHRAVQNRPAGKVLGFARVKKSSVGQRAGTVQYDLAGVGHDDDADEELTETRAEQACYSAAGVCCRPREVEEEGELAEVVVARMGDESLPIAMKDPRVLRWINKGATGFPLPRAGETLYAGQGGAFLSFLTREGTSGPEDDVTLRVPYQRTADGTPTKSDVVTIGQGADGVRIIDVRTGDGAALTIRQGVVTISTPGGSTSVTIGNDGVGINGSLKAFGGAEIGGPGALPLAKHAAVLAALQAVQLSFAAIITGAGIPPAPTAPIGAALSATMTDLGAAIAALGSPVGTTTLLKGV